MSWREKVIQTCFDMVSYYKQDEIDLIIKIQFAPQEKIIKKFITDVSVLIDALDVLSKKKTVGEYGKIIKLIENTNSPVIATIAG
jgi:hypothetical protein